MDEVVFEFEPEDRATDVASEEEPRVVEYFEDLGPLQRFEPPAARLSRLQEEVTELLKTVGKAPGGPKDPFRDAQSQESDLNEATRQLQLLGGRLQQLATQDPFVLGAKAGGDSVNSQLDHLATVGNAMASERGTPGRNELNGSVLVHSEAVDHSRIAAMEDSLAGLEHQLGVFEGMACPFADLQTAVNELSKRLAALDAERLDLVKPAVQKALTELDEALTKKAELDSTSVDQELDRKVNELFEFCHRWYAAAPSLPVIVSRLQSLRTLNRESGSFPARLAALQGQQQELAQMLEATSVAVQELGVTLKENMTIVKESMADLDAKMQAVAK